MITKNLIFIQQATGPTDIGWSSVPFCFESYPVHGDGSYSCPLLTTNSIRYSWHVHFQ